MGTSGYREPAEGFPVEDVEAIAAKELGRRAARLHAIVIVPVLLLGIVAGVTLYFMLRDIQFAKFGRHIPWVTGIVSIGPCLPLSLRLAQRAGRLAVVWRSRFWALELAEVHSLPPAALEDYRRVLADE